MVRVEQERFLALLENMYEKSRESGSVTISFKKVTPKDLHIETKKITKRPPKIGTVRALDVKKLDKSELEASKNGCLVRAMMTYKKRWIKKSERRISTLIFHQNLKIFQYKLDILLKKHINGLEKVKRNKNKSNK